MRTASYRAVKTSLGPDASALSVNKQCLYLAVTNKTIGTPLPLSVGPGFSMPPTVGYGLPAFQPLSTEALILAEDPLALADALVRCAGLLIVLTCFPAAAVVLTSRAQLCSLTDLRNCFA